MGKYHQFYKNNKQKPKLARQTIFSQKNKLKRLESNKNSSIQTNLHNKTTSDNQSFFKSNEIDTQSASDIVSTQDGHFEYENSVMTEDDNASNSNITIYDQIPTPLSNIDSKTKQKQICMALLTLFFSGDFSKTGLSKIIEFTQIFNDVKLPKSFINLINRLDKNPIQYEKKWYCAKCAVYVVLKHQYQRRCTTCNTK